MYMYYVERGKKYYTRCLFLSHKKKFMTQYTSHIHAVQTYNFKIQKLTLQSKVIYNIYAGLIVNTKIS